MSDGHDDPDPFPAGPHRPGLRQQLRSRFIGQVMAMGLVMAVAALAAWYFLRTGFHVDRLAMFVVIAATSIFLVFSGIAGLAYRAGRRVVDPVGELAARVRVLSSRKDDDGSQALAAPGRHAGAEVDTLSRAMHSLVERNRLFVLRERAFTRDASHELRSPLTVIKFASDLLRAEEGVSPSALKNIERIRGSVRDMEAMIEVFLILARESDKGLPVEDFLAGDIVLDEIGKTQALLADRPVRISCIQHAELELHAPPKVFALVFGHLLRDACQALGDGDVVVVVEADRIILRAADAMAATGHQPTATPPRVEVPPPRRGAHSAGITVVRRLCDRFGWRVAMTPDADGGALATLSFRHARTAFTGNGSPLADATHRPPP